MCSITKLTKEYDRKDRLDLFGFYAVYFINFLDICAALTYNLTHLFIWTPTFKLGYYASTQRDMPHMQHIQYP